MKKLLNSWTGIGLFFAVNLSVYSFVPSASCKGAFYLISLAVILLLCGLIWYARSRQFDLLRCFVPTALVIGLLYTAAVPAFRGADEELHFYRAYEISCGHLISENRDGIGGRELPVSLLEAKPEVMKEFNFPKLAEKWKIPLQPNEKTFIAYNTSALYAPVQYLPQAAGIFIGRLFRCPPISLVYWGRVGNLLFWIFACYYALKWLRGAPLVYLIALLPSMLHNASVLSADAVTMGYVLLLVALILHLLCFERAVTRKDAVLLSILAFAVSLCKIVYMPFCFLLLMLPKRLFRDRKQRLMTLWGIIIACIGANLIWLSFSWGFLNEVNQGVNASEQLKLICANPFHYLRVLCRTLATDFNFYLQTIAGANFCLYDVPIYMWITDCYLVLLGCLAVFHNPLEVPSENRWLPVCIAVSVFLLINTSLYLQWNPVGADYIDGIQGRYFIPLLPLLFFFRGKKSSLRPQALTVYTTILLAYPVVITLLLKHL